MPEDPAPREPPRQAGRTAVDQVWRRGEEPEFARLAIFTDGVYAIALTLLVLSLAIGHLKDPASAAEMWSALGDLIPDFVAFGVAFVLLARYWMTHHDFYARLEAVDHRLMTLNLTYLLFVAFLPFPTSLVGGYEQNPVSIIVFATTLAGVSGMETVMFAYAHHAGLLDLRLGRSQFRWGVMASLVPVVMFVVTMPFAFISPTGVLVSWAIVGPLLYRIVASRAPEDTPGAELPMIVARRRAIVRRAAARRTGDEEGG